jgi:hypothetical protein
LRELASEVDRLPPFVRGHVRRHVVDELAQKRKLSKGVRAAPLFPASTGEILALDEASERLDALDLPLADHVALVRALGRTITLPPMPDAWRQVCLVTAKVSRIAEGEVGITFDAPRGSGVTVSHLGRTIANLPSLLGFPARGAVEVPTLTRSEMETGKLDPLRVTALVAAAESALVGSIDGMGAPSTGYLARRFVDRKGPDAVVVGWVWVPEGPPAISRIVTPIGDVSRSIPGRSAPLPLPINGSLFVSGVASEAAVRQVVHDACVDALGTLVSTVPEPRGAELEAYLSFVGAPTTGEPAALPELRSAVVRKDLIGLRPGAPELLRRGGQLVIGGDHPLARALVRWAPSLVRLEEVVPPASSPSSPEVAEVETPAAEASPVAPGPTPEQPPETGTGVPPPRLLDGFLKLFGIYPTWNAPAAHPVVRRLERVLTRLPIPNGTVIAFSKGGRPVRFDAKRAVVDPEHPVVLALLQQDDVSTLAAAILTEANRATKDLTDAEERRALVSLLLET